MSIATEINRIYVNIQHAYDAIREKGGEVPGEVPGEVSLISIAVTSMPTKTSYTENEALNLTGLVVTATYDDSSTKTVTNYTAVPTNGANLTTSNKSVVITYSENGVTKETSFAITVKAVLPTFANCTAAEFLQIAQALQSGEISVSDLTNGWTVGDTKTVHLNAFNTYSSSTSSTASQAAQDATMVILHKKSGSSCAGKQFSDGTVPSFIIGFKDNVCKSYWGKSNNTYQNSLCWNVENNIYNALPTEYKQAFGKQFKAITGIWASSTSSQSYTTYNRNMCSPAEAELFGDLGGYQSDGYCIAKESAAIGNAGQFDYYKTQANRKHTNITNFWWERSPSGNTGNSGYACGVTSVGTPNLYGVSGSVHGLAPFGCI